MDQSVKRYWLETYGCQMNFAESNALERDLLHHGYMPAKHPEEASVVILNTCSVRKTAEDRIWGRLGYFKKMKQSHHLTLVLTGCMGERLIHQKLSDQGVDVIIGTAGKNHIISYLTGKDEHLETYEFNHSHYREGDLRSFVPIMNGCNNFCSYCIVPYVRGREISRSPEDILQEIDLLTGKGVKEITLLGQNVNSYAYHEFEFLELLEEIARRTEKRSWVRFMSSHPKDISPELGDLISRYDSLCSHIHLPVQHGSDRILAQMNRKYTRGHYIEMVDALKRRVDGLTFSTDLLIGFPGETEQDVEDTLDLMDRVGFTDAFTYYFNPREGTKAVDLPDQLPHELKLERLQRVIDIQRSIQIREKKKRIGKTEIVLVEDRTKKDHNELLARSEHDDMVIIPTSDAAVGEFVQVGLKSLSGSTFRGDVKRCGN